MPSEFLKINIDDFQFNLFVASIGTQDEAKQLEKTKRNTKHRGK